MSIGST